ncbi:protein-disulfide reductase DsbD domain-containing protein [Ahrensia sp. R2A130]|uniref:protein-disulfide reductase DsbD domain-containing protein n=1 Tax=Ahrensia sp. R2A130 TaxID=744979 RepID=UPI0001E0D86C|nr:protein-disulfide reductase DsbD domain-containing protein [Ahrensia sp. R2A130]EFL88892.1 ribosomal protein S7 [Ahrensia sp. R2A130]
MKIKLLALTLSTLLTGTALAAESVWFETDGARLRLIALPAADGATIDAGLQIELQQGWKTYWKAPGASGLPPQITFEGSQNVAATRISYPLPTTFGSKRDLTAGYTSTVTLPITIEPLFAGRPLSIKGSGFLGVCEDICVPVQFEVELEIDGTGVSKRDIASALLVARSSVPPSAQDDMSITGLTQNDDVLIVTAKVPVGATSATLFPDGPSDWYLGPVHASSVKDGVASFKLPIDQRPKSASVIGTTMSMTLRAGDRGIEQVVTISH